MPRKKIIRLLLIGSAGFFLTAVITLTIAGSWYVNSDRFQNNIRSIVTEKLGNHVQFQRVSLSLLFRPHLTFYNVNVSVPETTTGTVQAIHIYPKLWPLLTGTFQIAKFRATAPDFSIKLPAETEQSKREGISFLDVKEDIASVLNVLRSIDPDLIIEVKNGKLLVSRTESNAIFAAHDIRGRLGLLPQGFDLSVWGNPDRLGPTSIHGRFAVAGNRVAADNVKIAVSDSTIVSSGEVVHSIGNIHLLDISMDGTLGKKTVQLISSFFNLPPEQTIRAPLALSQARLIWKPGPEASLSGTFALKKGPTISLQGSMNPKELSVSRLVIQDTESSASLSFKHTKKDIDISFKGSLNEKTLEKLFERTSFHHGWIRGNFTAHIQPDNPWKSSASGTIEGSNIILPLGPATPLKIAAIALKADNKTATLQKGAFSWEDATFTLAGTLQASSAGFYLNMDLSSDAIKIETIQRALSLGNRDTSVQEQEEETEHFPLFGTVHLNANSISYGRFSTSPVQADITLDQRGIHVAFLKASLCGISLPGTMTVFDDEFFLDFKPDSVQQPFESTLLCLTGSDNTRITGTFDLQSHLYTQGKSDDLIRTLQGRVTFTAKEGEIYRYPLLARIFAAINITDMMRGKFPDLSRTGFAYNALTVKGVMKNGKLLLHEATIDGITANLAAQGEIDIADGNIDITVLVAPFKTVDFIVKNIPLVGDVLGNTLITIPVKVQGKINDPTVTILSPTAIGEGLIGIMKRTLQLPFKVIQPILPDKKQSQPHQ